MRKTDKKIENNIRIALTKVCEQALKEVDGFLWLTHTVNYGKFPESLQILCAFDSDDSIEQFLSSSGDIKMNALIKQELAAIDIKTKNISNHVSYALAAKIKHALTH